MPSLYRGVPAQNASDGPIHTFSLRAGERRGQQDSHRNLDHVSRGSHARSAGSGSPIVGTADAGWAGLGATRRWRKSLPQWTCPFRRAWCPTTTAMMSCGNNTSVAAPPNARPDPRRAGTTRPELAHRRVPRNSLPPALGLEPLSSATNSSAAGSRGIDLRTPC